MKQAVALIASAVGQNDRRSLTVTHRALQAGLLWLLFSLVGTAADRSSPFLPDGTPDVGWPQLRGPQYDGVSSEINLADSWPEEGPPVLWTKELGQGYASFSVRDDRALTQYQTLAGQFVLCVDANTGKTIWEHRYDWPFEAAGMYPGPFSTPTIANKRIYFSTPSGAVHCLDWAGSPIWSADLKVELKGKGTDFGYACSPTVVDGKVILPVGGQGASLVALDANDGQLIWKSGDEHASYVPAFPITLEGRRLVIGYLEHSLVAHDLATGTVLWEQTISHGYDEHAAWPIYREPFLWTAAPFQSGSTRWQLSGGEHPACRMVWQRPVLSNDVASSVLVGETLYGFDLAEAQSKAHRPSRGCFSAVDWNSGDLLWRNGDAKTRRDTDFASNRTEQIVGHACVLAGDGKLFLLTDLGDLILAEANPDEYVELGRVRVLGGEICWSTPALDHGRLFLRNQSRAVCLYVGEAELAEAHVRANSLRVTDLPQTRLRDYTAFLGVEPEYAMDPPTYRWLRRWYLFGVAILLISGTVAATAIAVLPARCIKGKVKAKAFVRPLFCGLVFLLGMVVGPSASLIVEDFVFTWPLCLFIAFAVLLNCVRIRRGDCLGDSRRVRRRSEAIAFVFFLCVCVLYFLICRRLSLVTEWAFLVGFSAAVPILLLDRYLRRFTVKSQKDSWRSCMASWLLIQVGFAAYFWSTVGLLAFKYDLPSF